MDTNNIIFLIISILIIAFNTYTFYKGYQELKKSREELDRIRKMALEELNKSYQEAKAAKGENK